MRNTYYFKSFSLPALFILLILSILLVQPLPGQEKFWIPSDPPQAHYKIDARINLPNNIVEGKETIILHNNSSGPISLLGVDWSITDSRSIEININGKSLPLLNTVKKPPISSPLLYALPQPVKPGSRVKLNVKFSAGGLVGGDEKEIKLIKWYPRLWWDGLPTHDVFEVKLDIPAGYTLAVSGRLNRATGYYENEGVRTFGVYLGKDLKTEDREVEGILITSLFTEEGAECARLCLETAADVVKFYKSWLGFYPFKFLYIIPGASRPMGGYPFASGIVVIHGQERFKAKPLLHWKWITSHEIGHQYWGEYVMDNDISPWLWIGMGIYADREYTIFRSLGMDKHTGLMNRYLEGVRKRFDTTVDISRAQRRKIKYDYNNVVIHGKGYSIISALEFVLGKELFGKIYKRCLKDYGRKCLGYREFWRVCEEESGENLKWFFDQWVRSNKYLSYQIVSKESVKKNGGYISNIKVESLGSLQMPVPIKAVFEDGSSQVKFTNRLFRVNNPEFESKSKLKEAILNPDNKLALLETPLEATPEELSEIISLLPWAGAGEDALKAYAKAKSLKLDNVRSWFKLGLTLFDGGYYKESFNAFEKFTELNPSQLDHFAALVWMGHIQDLFGNREEALKYYNEALKHDIGGTMRHDQWGMKIDRQWVEERLKTPFKWGKK
jgi:tetratricopeptide (TPR) repeat protein